MSQIIGDGSNELCLFEDYVFYDTKEKTCFLGQVQYMIGNGKDCIRPVPFKSTTNVELFVIPYKLVGPEISESVKDTTKSSTKSTKTRKVQNRDVMHINLSISQDGSRLTMPVVDIKDITQIVIVTDKFQRKSVTGSRKRKQYEDDDGRESTIVQGVDSEGLRRSSRKRIKITFST